MSVKTKNVYGTIIITNRTIERYIFNATLDSYGIVGYVHKNLFDVFFSLFKRHSSNSIGVKVRSSGDRIFIEVSVVVKFGVSIKAVVDALKESIKYKVEKFTGMIVDTIDVNVVSVRL